MDAIPTRRRISVLRKWSLFGGLKMIARKVSMAATLMVAAQIAGGGEHLTQVIMSASLMTQLRVAPLWGFTRVLAVTMAPTPLLSPPTQRSAPTSPSSSGRALERPTITTLPSPSDGALLTRRNESHNEKQVQHLPMSRSTKTAI